jgi:lipopolysaccharide/colanic/teichoic acid biosynthesis glycosyltransferase
MRRYIMNLILDFIAYVISVGFVFFAFVEVPINEIERQSLLVVLSFLIMLIFASFIFDKYEKRKKVGITKIIGRVFASWFVVSTTLISALFIAGVEIEDRRLIAYSLFVFIIIELLLFSIAWAYRHAIQIQDQKEQEHIHTIQLSMKCNERKTSHKEGIIPEHFKSIILEKIPDEAYGFVKSFIGDFSQTIFLSTADRFNILQLKNNKDFNIINVCPVNKIRRINKFFESVNVKVSHGCVYVLCVMALTQRKIMMRRKYGGFFGRIFYFFDFIIHRLWPKFPYLKKIYFWFFKNMNRRLSYAETLGRLYSCGFEYVADEAIGEMQWVAVRKVKPPALDYEVTYSPLIKLKRIGKNGKMIRVYKLRTMHPYSEFLQDYVYKLNQLDEGGKFKNDFRISTAGRFFRRFWIDELPMIANLIKGDMKIVGVRPLSQHYYDLYPDDVKKLRTQFKPGLIPPFYSDMPKTFEEIVESERKYLIAYSKNRVLTDLKYFFKAFWNIVFRRARSK